MHGQNAGKPGLRQAVTRLSELKIASQVAAEEAADLEICREGGRTALTHAWFRRNAALTLGSGSNATAHLSRPPTAHPYETRRAGRSLCVGSAAAPAVRIALARMNSDSVTPRDLADWASMSRSCGRRRTATRAVRCRDSERGRDGVSRWAFSCFAMARLAAAGGVSTDRIRSRVRARRYNRAGVSRRLYRHRVRRSG
jgi:hypothetical protein